MSRAHLGAVLQLRFRSALPQPPREKKLPPPRLARSFAYVAYENVAGANGAVATLNGLDLEGREARVELSKAAEERPARVPRAAAPSGGAATGGARENASIVVIGLPADFQEDLLAKAFARASAESGRAPRSPPVHPPSRPARPVQTAARSSARASASA